MSEAAFGQCDRCSGLLTLFEKGDREEGVVYHRVTGKVQHVHKGCVYEGQTFIPIREWLDAEVAKKEVKS